MHKYTTVLASVFACLLVFASCSKTPAPSTSFVKCKYLGIDHLYTSKGLEQEGSLYVINGDESGSVNKLKFSTTSAAKGSYNTALADDNVLQYIVNGATYNTRSRSAYGNISYNKVDSNIFNIHGMFSGHLINVSDSTDYLDVSGEINVKYSY